MIEGFFKFLGFIFIAGLIVGVLFMSCAGYSVYSLVAEDNDDGGVEATHDSGVNASRSRQPPIVTHRASTGASKPLGKPVNILRKPSSWVK